MARSVRQGVFETNSSTQHSLTFTYEATNLDLKSIIGSNVLRFGVRKAKKIREEWLENRENDWFLDIDSTHSWQDRADILFDKLITNHLSAPKFLIMLEKIKEVFDKRGIKVEFLIKENLDTIEEAAEEDDYYWEEDEIYSDLLNYYSPKLESMLINFIFSPHILEYSFCDENLSFEQQDAIEDRIKDLVSVFPKDKEGFFKHTRG